MHPFPVVFFHQECYGALSSSSILTSDFHHNYTVTTGPAINRGLKVFDVEYIETDDAWFSPHTKQTYGGGGQVVTFDNDKDNVTAVWNQIKDHDFFDSSTRAVFVTLNLYNANVDLVGASRFSIEFSASGTIVTSAQIRCLPLIRPVRVLLGDGATSFSSLIFTLELVFFGMVVMYIIDEIRIIRNTGMHAYFRDFWCLLEFMNLSLFLVFMGLRALSLTYIGNIYDDFSVDNQYLKLEWVMYFARQVENVNAFNAVLTFMKLFKFVRENKKMSQVSKAKQRGSCSGKARAPRELAAVRSNKQQQQQQQQR